jgi:hypothetical protein
MGSGCSRCGVGAAEAAEVAAAAAVWFDCCCDSDACAARSFDATNFPGPFREVMLLLLSSFLP